LIEIVIGIVAMCGLYINVLVTTEGEAQVLLRQPFEGYQKGVSIGVYHTDVAMTTTAYEFDSRMTSHVLGNYTNNTVYTYKQAYEDVCVGEKNTTDNTTTNSSNYCNLRYAIWKWSSAFSTLGFIASVLVIAVGLWLVILGFSRDCLQCFCCCKSHDNDGDHCNSCNTVSCSTEVVVTFFNFLVGLLFAFAWTIIIIIRFEKNLNEVLANEINDQLNNNKQLYYYKFTFDPLQTGKSIWPLAIASVLSLLVAIYLLLVFCCRCCSVMAESHLDEERQRNEAHSYELL